MKRIIYVLLVVFTVTSSCSKNGGTQSTNSKYWHVKYVASTSTTGNFTAIYNSKEGELGQYGTFTDSWSYEGDFSKDPGINNKHLVLSIVGNFNSLSKTVTAKIIVDNVIVVQDTHTADNLLLSYTLH